MEIRKLSEFEQFIPVVAAWLYKEFGHLSPDASLERAISRIQERCKGDSVPICFIILDHGEPVGTCSLIKHELLAYPDLENWLASLYIVPSHRKKGFGSKLIKHVIGVAERFGLPKLYLYTSSSKELYESHGWREYLPIKMENKNFIIMSYDLSAN